MTHLAHTGARNNTHTQEGGGEYRPIVRADLPEPGGCEVMRRLDKELVDLAAAVGVTFSFDELRHAHEIAKRYTRKFHQLETLVQARIALGTYFEKVK